MHMHHFMLIYVNIYLPFYLPLYFTFSIRRFFCNSLLLTIISAILSNMVLSFFHSSLCQMIFQYVEQTNPNCRFLWDTTNDFYLFKKWRIFSPNFSLSNYLALCYLLCLSQTILVSLRHEECYQASSGSSRLLCQPDLWFLWENPMICKI